MLSRVAEHILWMSRYVERAENTARIVDVNFRLLLDIGSGADSAESWEPLLGRVPETRALFASRYTEVTRDSVCRFLTFDMANPDSILGTIAAARENARAVRESISSEMWEQINTLYLTLTSHDAELLWLTSPHAFYRQVQYGSQQFQGTSDATTLQDEGWHFLQVGRYLERADNGTRILDSNLHLLTAPPSAEAADAVQLIAVLKSCSAYEAFRRRQLGARIQPRAVVQFLLFDEVFPRSVLFCINAAWSALNAIGGSTQRRANNAVDRALGLLHAGLEYADIDEVLGMLPDYLDGVQRQINLAGDALHRVYLYSLLRPLSTSGEARAAQAMSEQQQQVRLR